MSPLERFRQPVAKLARNVSEPFARVTAGMRMLPDFVIVGAQRAGTTSLYKYLAQHPDVGRVRLGKGVHYFDTNAERSMAWYRSHFPLDRAKVPFLPGPHHVGEGAPYYMFHPECPRRIDAALPGVKVIAILRDPIERAHSQWVHETARGFEDLPFPDALRAEDERLAGEEALLTPPEARSFSHQHHSYVARGQYAPQVQRLWDVFGQDRVLVLPSTRLFGDPARTYAETLSFLGLPSFVATYEVHNARKYDKITPDEEAWLAERFADSNERLVEMLGPEFDFRRG
jgi:Sulfotransferase domain